MKQTFSIIIALVFIGFSILAGVQETPAEKIEPTLLFEHQSSAATVKFSMPREFTLDDQKNIYLFDYMSNQIVKFSPRGKLLLTFGKKGRGENEFKHLTAIRVFNNKLMALDIKAMFTFDLQGRFIKKQSFKETVTCEFPKMLSEDTFVGERNQAADLKKILTLRTSGGEELQRLTAYDLRKFFPDLQIDEDFFLNDTYARYFLYDSLGKGDVVWAHSDENKIYKYSSKESTPFITIKASSVPFPEAERQKMVKQKERIRKQMPSLHMYIPQVYPLIQKLFTTEGEVWVYIFSRERKGLVRYNQKGEEIGFYKLPVDLNVRKARFKVIKNKIYILIPGRKSFKMLSASIPGHP